MDDTAKRRGVAALGESLKSPQVPGALADQYAGLGAVGEAVMRGGDILSALAIKKKEAQTDLQVADADNLMLAAKERFEIGRRDSPDPSTWGKLMEDSLQQAREKIYSNKDLNEGAKEAIELRLRRFEGQSKAQAELAATKEMFDRAKSGFIATIDRARESQDRELHDATVQAGQKRGYFYEHEAEDFKQQFARRGQQLKAKAVADERDAHEARIVTIASTFGEADAKDYITEGVGDDVEKERLLGVARRVAGGMQRDAHEAVLEGIADGSIKTEARIDEIATGNPHLTARAVEGLKEHLKRMQDSAEREKMSTPEAIARAQAEIGQRIRAYKRSEDPDGEEANRIHEEIGIRLGREHSGYMRDMLRRKFTGADSGVPKEINEVFEDAIRTAFDADSGPYAYRSKRPVTKRHDTDHSPLFGDPEYKAGDPVYDKAGKPVPERTMTGSVKMETVEDKAKRSEAVDTEYRVRRKYMEWKALNPVDASDPAKVRAKVAELMGDTKKIGAMKALRPSLAPIPDPLPMPIPDPLPTR